MKKVYLILILLVTITLPACESDSSDSGNSFKDVSDIQVKLTVGSKEIIVDMYDNPASRDFIEKLPMTLIFQDYNRIEKISYMPEKLTIEGSPPGADPSVGDLAYYAPWENLVIYYGDFDYSSGIILLGHIKSGVEKIKEWHRLTVIEEDTTTIAADTFNTNA